MNFRQQHISHSFEIACAGILREHACDQFDLLRYVLLLLRVRMYVCMSGCGIRSSRNQKVRTYRRTFFLPRFPFSDSGFHLIWCGFLFPTGSLMKYLPSCWKCRESILKPLLLLGFMEASAIFWLQESVALWLDQTGCNAQLSSLNFFPIEALKLTSTLVAPITPTNEPKPCERPAAATRPFEYHSDSKLVDFIATFLSPLVVTYLSPNTFFGLFHCKRGWF